MADKSRLDVAVTDRGLAPSRAKAQGLIMAGKVRVNGDVVTKSGAQVDDASTIDVDQADHPWVGRGALKLIPALESIPIDPRGFDCLDVGASTGGFTHLLLDRGARRVIALDVGRNQLDWRLRSDDRVVVMEGVNARHLEPGSLPFTVQLITIDVSFISLRLVVPAVIPFLDDGGYIVCLVKPQFEAGREQVGKGGIVRDEAVRRQVVDDVVEALESFGLNKVSLIPSPIAGRKGNREELAILQKPAGGLS